MSEWSADDTKKLILEIQTGQPSNLRGPEADAKRERLRRQIREIEARGGTVHVPADIP